MRHLALIHNDDERYCDACECVFGVTVGGVTPIECPTSTRELGGRTLCTDCCSVSTQPCPACEPLIIPIFDVVTTVKPCAVCHHDYAATELAGVIGIGPCCDPCIDLMREQDAG